MSLANRTVVSGLDVATTRLLAAAFGLTVLHITDHVLRVDHSGWPFRPEVTPFTFSLLAFPMLLFALLGPRRLYWWRWALLLAATIATLFAHVVIETPHMQFAMWATTTAQIRASRASKTFRTSNHRCSASCRWSSQYS